MISELFIPSPLFSEEFHFFENAAKLGALGKKHYIVLADRAEKEYRGDVNDYRRSYCENPEDLIALVDSYGDGSVGVCWDFGHANFVLADQPRALRKLGSRIKTTHVQDNRGAVDSHLIPFVGGNVKWEKIMPCLAEIGYVGDIVLDAPSYTKDFPDALKPSAVAFALEAGRYLLSL